MITFKPVVYAHQKRADGTYNVKIKITFKRKARHLATTIFCTPQDLTRSLKIKNGDILNKCNELIGTMRSTCSNLTLFELEDKDVDFVVRHIRQTLQNDSFHLDFFSFGRELVAAKKVSTKATYLSALNSFADFLGVAELDINEITRSMLVDFYEHLNASPKYSYNRSTRMSHPSSTKALANCRGNTYLSKLGYIYKEAKKKYNDEDSGRIVIPRSPFNNIDKGDVFHQGQRNLGVDIIQKMVDTETQNKNMRIALDAFLLSFCLMGANLADMYEAKNVGAIWAYNRVKTKDRRKDRAEMRLYIPAPAEKYIARLQDGTPCYWLPVLRGFSGSKDTVSRRVNDYLKKWCKQNDIEEFTFYAARHTWASLGRKLGIEKATIDECLVHKGEFNMADIYAERDWEIINEANARVLALIEW